MTDKSQKILIVGAGLAGSDCAYYLASRGHQVVLVEGKKIEKTPAQTGEHAAELVCTNSLKSEEEHSAHGLLKSEMVSLGSLIIEKARAHQVPAGGALAVDRVAFSKAVDGALKGLKNIQWVERICEDPIALAKEFACNKIVISSGPLTLAPLENWIVKELAKDDFYFYDAIAPVVDGESLDKSKMYYKDRYCDLTDREADYLNIPLNKKEYENFISEMVKAEKVAPAKFEKMQYFEACLPIDLMAERGVDTARFSCMKPVGLEQEEGSMHHAVVQLRRENLKGDAFNLVGFQTRLTYGEQKRIFRMLPGFEEANFLHLGSVHRNSFLNAKALLNSDLSSKSHPDIYFAGQMTGVEGYTESAAIGLYVGFQIDRVLNEKPPLDFPTGSAIGALVNYIMTVPKPTPSNINFGLLPAASLTKEERRQRKGRKKVKKLKAALMAKETFRHFLESVL